MNNDSITLDGSVARNEGLRKLIHIAAGLVALSLKFLTYEQALLLAAAAIVHNVLVLPRLLGKAVSRRERWSDAGIVFYPIAVFIVIAVFKGTNLHIAAAAWCVLAFGDGCASLVGRNFGRRKWQWNQEKSVIGTIAFIEAALATAYAICLFVPPQRTLLPLFVNVTVAVVVAAIVETLPTRIDDNLSVTFTAAITLWWMEQLVPFVAPEISRTTVTWLAVNVALATLGYVFRSVSWSGWLGGIILGAILIVAAGWPVYLSLLLFFVIGTGATKLGYASKAREGLAQEKGGRRGFSHAFANVGVAALCAASIPLTDISPGLLWFLGTAALATAAADTASSEIGQWLGRRAFLPLTLRNVERGTEGAISVEGTIAGAIAASIVATVGVCSMAWRNGRDVIPFDAGWELLNNSWSSQQLWSAVGIVAAAGVIGSYAESVIGSLRRRDGERIPNGVLNFLNTAIGAVTALLLAHLAGLKP